MSAFPSPCTQSEVVSRLRAAGCVFAEDEARLLISAADSPADLAAMVDRRAAGLPLEHVLGWAEFCGLRVAVDAGVFVPRRRTEFLVTQAVQLARRTAGPDPGAATPASLASLARPAVGPAPETTAAGPAHPIPVQPGIVVVDVCCGSGAMGLALAAALDRVELYAVDIDPAAVACARRNLAAIGGRVYQGDLFQPLPASLRGRVDVLLANAPYVPTEAVGLLPAEARVYEHRVALDGGPDGLDVLRRVAARAPEWLVPGGHLLVETSERQAPLALEAMARAGLAPSLAGSAELNASVIIGTRPACLTSDPPTA
jgi:release factor glutamine methyltransferase